MKALILGGARSGKSALAQQFAEQSGLQVTYIATATAGDAEMEERIGHHQRNRPSDWQLVEEPMALADVLLRHAATDRLLLVDCLTLWLSNLMAAGPQALDEVDALLEVLPELPGQVVLVSNEVGLGVIPLGELTRQFVDESGRLHQALASLCDQVTWVVAGLPHKLKG